MTRIDKQIQGLLEPLTGTFGFTAWHPGTGERIAINDREVFRSASVIKVPLMVDLFCRRDEGEVSMSDTFILRDECKVDGSGVLRELHAGAELTLMDLIALMIVLSDNTATNMLVERYGTNSCNERMRGFGLENTVFARKMYDWDAAKAGKENLCTAHDLAVLLDMMAAGRISSNSTSTEMVEIMARQQYREKIPLLLPEGTKIANKTGSLTGVTHDVGIVYGPGGPYVLTILTKDVSDVVAAERAIAEVSRLVYGHFCP
jgi:beta-lactamase class A